MGEHSLKFVETGVVGARVIGQPVGVVELRVVVRIRWFLCKNTKWFRSMSFD